MGRRGRGGLTTEQDRLFALSLIHEAVDNGARKWRACEELGLQLRTVQRWEKNTNDKRKERQYIPKNKLSEQEREQIVKVSCEKRFQNKSPKEIVPILAEEGCYLGSESSYYRVLRENDMVKHRRKSRPPKHKRPEPLEASKPDQVWSWDITYLQTTVRGIFFYLYMIIDIFSRKITGWEIHDREDNVYSSELLKKITQGNKMPGLYLHSDNGGPMKGATFLATLQSLGIVPSYSRPRCSNDNAFSESLFKTLKYTVSYPGTFSTIGDAQIWVRGFVEWYNCEHRHSGIGYVTPEQKYTGKDIDIIEKRRRTYEEAMNLHPERWRKNKIRDWTHVVKTVLNKRNSKTVAA